jgi:hypothetical protein
MKSKEYDVTIRIKAVQAYPGEVSLEDLKDAIITFFKLHNGDTQDVEVNGIRLLMNEKTIKFNR